MRYLKLAAVGVAALIAATIIFLIAADRIAQPTPPDPAGLIARAQLYNARIQRDTFGVPHVSGARDVDVAFGFAYAHAEDDFATIQEVALAVRGQLAAIQGRKAAVTDYLVHLFRVWETIDARYESDLPADVRRVLEAYADGVNYYAALHSDQVTRGMLPFTGKDVAAGFVFKLPFFYGMDRVLRNVTSPERAKGAGAAFLFPGAGLPVGSNAVAVGPARSADGATRLLVNSHQPYTGPVAWYEAVLDSGEGWHVAGGFFPGSPFMLHGHNAHLGWANTVNEPDLADVYQLTLNPANPNQYKLDGQWRDFEKGDAKIRVKIWGPLVWTVHREVLWSAHGPVLKTDRGAFAIRYAGMNEVRQPLQYFRLNKARNLEEWRSAMQLQALPSINFVYADEKGNIGYIYNGLFPVRQPGFDWQGTLPGDRSDLIWRSYLPFDKVPQLWNPRAGLVFNSNNTPFHATSPGEDLKPEDFAPTLGIQTDMTNRAWRALETFGADPRITAEAFRKYKYDLSYSTQSEEAHILGELTAIDPGQDADLKEAVDILKHLDRKIDVANRGAALAILTIQPVLTGRLEGRNPTPREALRETASTLRKHFGRLDPEWGQVNRLRRGKLDVAIDGGPDTYRAVYGEQQPDGTLKAMAGDTFIMFVAWDKAGQLSSESIHQFGSATLDQNSRHYADQTPLFVAMKTKPVWFTQAQLSGHIENEYRPGERR
ncbi:MAG TPA: acylase [Bryobacteraceae bacterium]|nr:acylase [Bryobacteraceae bacterium]